MLLWASGCMCFFPGTHSFCLFFSRSHILDVGPSPTSMEWENILHFPGGKEDIFSENKIEFFTLILYFIFQGALSGWFSIAIFCNHIFYFQEILLCFLLHFITEFFFFFNKKICQVQPTPVKSYGAPANYSLVSKKMNTCFCITLSSKEVCYAALLSQ